MQFKHGFRQMLHTMGSDMEIIKDHGIAAEARSTVKALKNREKNHSRREYFGFDEGVDVEAGDTIQISGASDYWAVIDTEDQVVKNVLVQRKAIAEKVGPGPRTTAARAAPPPVPLDLTGFHAEVVRVAGPTLRRAKASDPHRCHRRREAVVRVGDLHAGAPRYKQYVRANGGKRPAPRRVQA